MGEAQDATEAARRTEKNPHQALRLRRPGLLPAQTPPLDFLDEQVKLIQEMGDHLPNLRRLPGPQAALGERLSQRLRLKHH